MEIFRLLQFIIWKNRRPGKKEINVEDSWCLFGVGKMEGNLQSYGLARPQVWRRLWVDEADADDRGRSVVMYT